MIIYVKAFKPQYDQSARLDPRGKSGIAWTHIFGIGNKGDFANCYFSRKSFKCHVLLTYWHSRPLQDTHQPEKEDLTKRVIPDIGLNDDPTE